MKGLQNRATQCRGCGEEIAFIKTEKGKSMPVNPVPVRVKPLAGGYQYITARGNFITGVIVGDAEDDPDSNTVPAYVSHFATCKKANDFRGRK